MSIRGIDTQIMITRSSDFAKDASAMQKRPEVTQDYQAIHARQNEAVQQKRVQHTSESEMERLRADEDGGNEGAYDGQGGDRENGDQAQEEQIGPGMIVAPGNHMIDIKV